ncbi:hypothetical protein [Carboxylicivirga linearis]|uniref:Lipocalin-like domain-containing protein n=1 Tax=Carboxylicivirga linearis TaxID=1628157 RepID=A0ABS5JPD1_9BACT|nr:hypothetical protein [Carboxylicivirga linearis]MBS2096754.1 hypothetical protein [Carboxylicivirga linearis]
MRRHVILVILATLIAVLTSCDDQSEQVTQQDIITHMLLNNNWQIQIVKGEQEQKIESPDCLLSFSSDQSLLLHNSIEDKGTWQLRAISPVEFYDELEPTPEDNSNLHIWDDAEELLLELTLQLNKRLANDVNGSWIITGYNKNTVYLQNDLYRLIFVKGNTE